MSIGRYSYIASLSDIYKSLDIEVDFVSIKASNGLTIEKSDLLLIMELYKNSPMITSNVSPVFAAISIHSP